MEIAIEVVLTMVILMVAGYFIYGLSWAGEKAIGFISKLLLNITTPAMLLYSMVNSVSHSDLISFGALLPITLLILIALYYLSYLFSKVIKVKKGRQWTFSLMGSVSNTIFLGLPVCTMVFGIESVPYVMLGFVSGSIITFTFGITGIVKDSIYLGVNNSAHLNIINQLKQMFLNPIMISLFIGLFLNILDISYFPSLNQALEYVANMTTPLSLLFIGMFMRTMKLNEFKIDKDTFFVLLIRFMIAPLFGFIVYYGFRYVGLDISDYSINVLVLQIACCVLTMTSIFAVEYKADGKFATKTVALSNIVFLFFLPIYIMLLT